MTIIEPQMRASLLAIQDHYSFSWVEMCRVAKLNPATLHKIKHGRDTMRWVTRRKMKQFIEKHPVPQILYRFYLKEVKNLLQADPVSSSAATACE